MACGGKVDRFGRSYLGFTALSLGSIMYVKQPRLTVSDWVFYSIDRDSFEHLSTTNKKRAHAWPSTGQISINNWPTWLLAL